ncbi:hypothetical protein HR060_02880 [Catenovulum sp. SM1970]|uniref:hypothetical protein n=1 Tax=Marinifaba aquimaris TaxID=2741323 RepID=UPI001571BC64|nr:hypothetical protein [Marinifaba aquimaris]NTS75800.1 hypothetical protein [Marinifaba aquimaris]
MMTEQKSRHEAVVCQQLDQAVEQLPDSTNNALLQARLKAISAATNASPATTSYRKVVWASCFSICTVLGVSLFSLHSTQVEPIPLALLQAETVPTEDLALLEDYELMAWLAQNEVEL